MTPLGRYLTCAILFLSVILSLLYFNYEPQYGVRLEEVPSSSRSSSNSFLEQVLQFIYNPHGFSITTPSFSHEGKVYDLPSDLLYTSALGKDICILDVDTRPFDAENQIFHGDDFDWSKLDPYSGGIINHYMYAKTHGYDYKFLQATTKAERHPTWVKVPSVASILSSYKFVVFLDSDALFNQMHIPMEWMLNYWSIDSTISLAMALDPPSDVNNDTHGRRYSNTGFIIAQNNPMTHEILTAWDECPDERRYKGCAEWNNVRFHEQSAFGTYVRYDYEEYLKELPCDEANGEWDLEVCRGVFVQHMWWRTPTVRSRFGERTLQSLMERMQTHMLDEKEKIVESRVQTEVH